MPRKKTPGPPVPVVKQLRSRAAMERWQRMECLFGGELEEITPPLHGRDGPSRTLPGTASFVLVTPTRDGEAYETIPFRRLRFEAEAPTRWDGPDGATQRPPTGLRAGLLQNRHGLELWGDDLFLSARCWNVTELEPIIRPVAPWVDERFVCFALPDGRSPSPAQWVELGRRAGLDLVWANGRGEPVAPMHVTDSDEFALYERTPRNLHHPPHMRPYFDEPTRTFAVLFDALAKSKLELERQLAEVLCELPSIEVRTGNCRFTGSEWRDYLRTHAPKPRQSLEGDEPGTVLPLRPKR